MMEISLNIKNILNVRHNQGNDTYQSSMLACYITKVILYILIHIEL